MLNRKEILRYLGADATNETMDALIDRAQAAVENAVRPRHVVRHVPLQADVALGQVVLAGTVLSSRNLARHLQGCEEGCLFACTLGPAVDALIKRYALTEPPMLPVAQAVAAAYTELCADEAQRPLEAYASERNLYLRPRYSPGYGDFTLDNQRFLFDALEISKNIGITLTEEFIMIPFKSVTAVIGLSPDPSLCHINKCMTCTAKNCPFRKEDEPNV